MTDLTLSVSEAQSISSFLKTDVVVGGRRVPPTTGTILCTTYLLRCDRVSWFSVPTLSVLRYYISTSGGITILILVPVLVNILFTIATWS